MNYLELHQQFKEHALFGRYITLKDIEPIVSKWDFEKIGASVLGKAIYKYTIGNGTKKVFMWSQMHGNEGTTTKALFDFLNLIHSDDAIGKQMLSEFTFCFLPMVNPDGAELYTRENANEIDLNRDAKNLSQPESIVLRQTFEDFKPHFCYNLHDQRTIYSAGNTSNPATVSFLAPSFNISRTINENRGKAMNIIAAMNATLQNHIPNQVGRYEDEFNDNCIGETFQMKGAVTILFESGHFPNDYYREFTRKMIFIALVSGLRHIYENDIVISKQDDYLNIPQNNVNFYDFIYKNVKISLDAKEIITNFAAQYSEELVAGKLQFNAYIAEIGELKGKFGHEQFNAHKMQYFGSKDNFPKIDEIATFNLENNIKFVNGLKK